MNQDDLIKSMTPPQPSDEELQEALHKIKMKYVGEKIMEEAMNRYYPFYNDVIEVEGRVRDDTGEDQQLESETEHGLDIVHRGMV